MLYMQQPWAFTPDVAAAEACSPPEILKKASTGHMISEGSSYLTMLHVDTAPFSHGL